MSPTHSSQKLSLLRQQFLFSALFIILWSPGFVIAKVGLQYATPFTFIAIRLILAAMVMVVFVWLVKSPWPHQWKSILHLAISGIFLHAVYLGASWSAVYQQVPVGLVAIVAGLQPLLTGILAGPMLGEKVAAKQWIGLLLGFLGVALIVEPKLENAIISVQGLLLVILALFSITLGTLYQKKFCQGIDMRAGQVIQLVAALLVIAPMTYLPGEGNVSWAWPFVFTLLWLSVLMSVGAISILGWLIRRGAVSSVAVIFYIIPPLTTLYAHILFGENLGWLGILGMAVIMLGLGLALSPRLSKKATMPPVLAEPMTIKQ